MKIIYVKTTDTCQLNCSHCFTSGRFGGKTPWDVEATQHWVREYMKHYPDDELFHLEFHGGEPFLVELSEFYRFIEPFQGRDNVSFGATSNLVYTLSDEHLKFFKNVLDGQIGTSWDGGIRFETPKQYTLWRENLFRLKNHGIRVVLFVSITRELIAKPPEELFTLLEELKVDEVAFERLTAHGNATFRPDIFPDNEAQDLWYLAAYQLYKSRRWPFRIRSLEAIDTKVYQNNIKVDTSCRTCEQNLVTISADGSLSGCPNAASTLKHASIREPIKHFLRSDGRVEQIAKELTTHPTCLRCDVFHLCGGDCHRLSWQGDRCGGLKHLLRYVRDQKLSGVSTHE